jgi:sec-independent protein translocase protein TatA
VRLARQALLAENQPSRRLHFDIVFAGRRTQMFEGLFQPVHLMIIAGVALLVFGPKKLPELGKGLGESIRGFKAAIAAPDEEKPPAAKTGTTRTD